MSRYTTIYKEVEIDVDLEDFDDDDLLNEVESRGLLAGSRGSNKELLTDIWLKRRQGKDYQNELSELIYLGLGKIV